MCQQWYFTFKCILLLALSTPCFTQQLQVSADYTLLKNIIMNIIFQFLLNPTHWTSSLLIVTVNILIYLFIERKMGRLIRCLELPCGVFLHTDKSSVYIHRFPPECIVCLHDVQQTCWMHLLPHRNICEPDVLNTLQPVLFTFMFTPL